MKKKIVSLMISCLMLATLPQTALAQGTGMNEVVPLADKNPENMTAAEIIDELYANETNPDVYQCAKSSSMILTGEREIVDYYGTILIGTYGSPDVYYHANVSVPVGNTSVQASIDTSYTMVLPATSAPTPEMAAANKEALNLLYRVVQEAKKDTLNMPDSEKAVYLMEIVQTRLEKQTPATGRTATCLQNGYADCDGYAGLYYLVAMNCGLPVKAVLGTCQNEEHAWNMVEVDGAWKMVDPVMDKYFLSDSEMPRQGYHISHESSITRHLDPNGS